MDLFELLLEKLSNAYFKIGIHCNGNMFKVRF